jgi:tRNA 2-thiocytidine biosynthesis protein TtcA
MSVLEGKGYYLSKRMGRAISDYRMIDDGDKIVVAVSGGKDSFAMLHLLRERLRFVPIAYELIAVHVDSGYPRSHAAVVERFLKRHGYRYHIERVDIGKRTGGKKINCFWCAWNRRKALFTVAHRLGAKKVALGHHKDDIVETVLLNLFYHGEISAMVPRQELFGGKIVLIRPLAYCEESVIEQFVRSAGFPRQRCRCPNSLISRRTKMTRIIRDLERSCPEVKTNIFRSMSRIKKEYLLGHED